jgi:hypothetical protein
MTPIARHNGIAALWMAAAAGALLMPVAADAARLWSSGFELQSATAGVELTAASGTMAISTSTVRSGAASFRTNPAAATGYGDIRVYASNAAPGTFARAYLYVAAAPAAETAVLIVRDSGATDQASIRMNPDRTLEVWDEEDGAQVGSASAAVPLTTWTRIELKYDFGTAGTGNTAVEGRLDGTVFASSTTLNHANGIRDVRFGVATSTTADIFWDDVAVNEDQGTNQTSDPGSGKIVHLKPNGAGDADSGEDYPCAGGAAPVWDDIDEVTPNHSTDCAGMSLSGDRFDEAIQDSAAAGIGASDTITLVQVGMRAEADPAGSAGTGDLNARIKSQSGGTVVTGATVGHDTPGAVWSTNGGNTAPVETYKLTSYTDPQAGGAWTTALLDTAQIGAISNDASPDLFVSTMWALVEYVPPAPPSAGPTTLREGLKLREGAKVRP